MQIEDGSTILFQGDSITDCGRCREGGDALGKGYPFLVASWLSAMCPGAGLQFVNRGISGNRVKDLQARWQEDCLDLQPQWVSILIGVNDVWRRYDRDDPTTVDAFAEGYHDLLTQVRDKLGAQIILLEPFLLPTPEDRLAWREDLDPKINAVRALAREFGALYVPLDGIFASQCSRVEPAYWAGDGVHPSRAGHGLIASHWLSAVEALS